MEKTTLARLDETLQSSRFVILDFSSPGCAPCKRIAEGLPGLLAGLPTPVAAYEVDIAAEAAIAGRYFVLGVPTLILFKEGKEIGRFTQLPKADAIQRLLS